MITAAALALLGLAFGSFVNALVWRLHFGRDWVKSRSICPKCKHKLAPADLIPVLSWLMLRGRCRYCGRHISKQYPAVELAMAAVFVLSYIFWPGEVNTGGDWLIFITWLATSVGLMGLLVYDAKWMVLPSKILYPTAAVAAVGRLAYIIGFEADKLMALLNWAAAVAVASGLFFALYVFSKGRWIGFGDVRLGLLTGTLLATPAKSLLMIVLSSVLGTLYVLPDIIRRKKELSAKLPYGPFLIAGTFLSLLFGQEILDWYRNNFLP